MQNSLTCKMIKLGIMPIKSIADISLILKITLSTKRIYNYEILTIFLCALKKECMHRQKQITIGRTHIFRIQRSNLVTKIGRLFKATCTNTYRTVADQCLNWSEVPELQSSSPPHAVTRIVFKSSPTNLSAQPRQSVPELQHDITSKNIYLRFIRSTFHQIWSMTCEGHSSVF